MPKLYKLYKDLLRSENDGSKFEINEILLVLKHAHFLRCTRLFQHAEISITVSICIYDYTRDGCKIDYMLIMRIKIKGETKGKEVKRK